MVPFVDALDPMRLLKECGKFVTVKSRAGEYITGFCTFAEREVVLAEYLCTHLQAQFMGAGQYVKYIHKEGLSFIYFKSIPCVAVYERDRPVTEMESELLLHELRQQFKLPVFAR